MRTRLVAVNSLLSVLGLSLMGVACGTEVNTVPGPEGGTSSAGGSSNSGSGGSGASGGSSATGGSTGTGAGGTGSQAGGSSGGGGVPGGQGGSGAGLGGISGAGSGSGSGGTGQGIDDYNPDFKEFVGEDCELPDPAALSPASHKLPDPFMGPDGMRMTTKAQWACQRAWLKKQVEKFAHGAKPPKPTTVTGTVSGTGINVHVEEGGQSADFMIPISRPQGATGAIPGMFQAEGSGVPTTFLHGEGVAAMSYSHSSAESAYNKLYSGTVSIQIKWAWAVSRAIDVLVAQRDAGMNDILDPTALGTTGCSYAGKSAFTVGAFDERIALGLPQESGTGGLGSWRVVADKDLGPNAGEDPEQVSEACGKNWLVGQVCNGSVDGAAADSHFLVAMYAPRGFTTLDNNRIGHLGPVAQYTADAAGAEVFKALGVESHIGYHGGNDDDPHNHCMFYPSQEDTARKAIQAFLTKKIPPANFMEPKLKNQNDQAVDWSLAEYIDWQTPALN